MDAGLIAPVVIIAFMVVRTALAELRTPGAARATWAFIRDPAAAAAAAVPVAAVLVSGSRAVLAWGLLAGSLTGHLVHQVRSPGP
ncbi:hypothetical protein [Streptomyces microflavus]|uniref:hypothetical protein n=1 Tax=Streptomyces microflavus TaxID=1919 RepID=UPI002E37592F|nr:hypothetical protein [Streptomyces microflavus]WTF67195.1 hypothetical protein OH770_00380 [Streptomyces microflavus]